jgi:hypothetical protein
LNRPDEARLLQETLDEETRTARKLMGMVEAITSGEMAPPLVDTSRRTTAATPPHGDKLPSGSS